MNGTSQTPITVTVTDTATIFNGPDTIYRDDLPGSGIIEGWALLAIVDQLRQLAPTSWPDVEVIVDADHEIAESLIRTLINKGAAAYPATVVQEKTEEPGNEGPPPMPGPSPTLATPGDDPVVALRRDRRQQKKTPRRRVRPSLVDWLPQPAHLAVGVVALVGGGVALWSITTSVPDDADLGVTPVADSTAATPTPALTTAADPSPVVATNDPPHVHLEEAGLSLDAPQGFELRKEGDTWMLTGPDEDLRVSITADPSFGLSPQLLLDEIRTDITKDPQLHLVTEAPESTRVIYTESPEDGSHYRWTTWVEADRHISVGCHSRYEPTVVQRATCRIITESMHLQPEGTEKGVREVQ